MSRDTIRYTLQMDVHDGKMPEFKAVAERAIAETKTRDEGCVAYQWGSNGNSVQLHDRFTDEAAVVAHADWVEPIFGELLGLSTLSSFDVHGAELSPETRARLEGFGARIFAPMGGFDR